MLLFAVLAQPVTAMIANAAAHVVDGDRHDSLWVFFAYKKLLGRTETRTRERKCFQSIRTVRDISRDDRARIATCSLRTATYLRRITVYIRNEHTIRTKSCTHLCHEVAEHANFWRHKLLLERRPVFLQRSGAAPCLQ